MTSYIKSVFYIVAVMMMTMLLLMVVSSDTSKDLILSALEPAFENLWMMNTMDDGELITSAHTTVFEQAVDMSN